VTLWVSQKRDLNRPLSAFAQGAKDAKSEWITPHLLEHTVSFPFYRATNMTIKELRPKKFSQDVLK
jgi:hypothetical protein